MRPESRAERGTERGTERWVDAAIVVLVLGVSAAAIAGRADLPVWALSVAAALALLQVPPLLLRRTRPRGALLLYAPVLFLLAVSGLPGVLYTGPVLAFALLRRGRPAIRFLAVVVLLPIVAAAVLATVLLGEGVAFGTGFAVGATLAVGTQVAVGAVLGAAARAAADRAGRERAAAERARVAAAVEAERTRIADEVAGGVLTGLRRIVAVTADPVALRRGAPATLAALQAEVRELLAGLRRVLTALRAPTPPADPPHGPVGRRLPLPTTSGVVLAGVLAALVVLTGTLLRPVADPALAPLLAELDVPWDREWTLPLLGVQLLALAWWRSAPVPALVVATVGSMGSWVIGSNHLFAEAGWLVLLYAAAGAVAPLVSGVVVGVCAAVLLGWYLLVPSAEPVPVGTDALVVGFALLTPLIWVIGVLHRSGRQRAARDAAALAVGRVRGEVDAERLRVARDLHDVVAHHLSAIAVQAGAARSTDDPAVLAEAVGHIADTGRRIAAGLPALAATTHPSSAVTLTEDGIEALLGPARTAGVPVTVTVSGRPSPVAGDAEVFAERIVAEALTNVVRHAGPSATSVVVEHRPDEIAVEVRDSGPVAGHRVERLGSGLGLLGMRERAALLGGSVRAEPDGDGFAVRARLPRPVEILLQEEAAPPPTIVPAADAPERPGS